MLMQIIELCRETQSELDNTYDLFCESVIREMTETIPKHDWSAKTRKKLRFHKPFWNADLTELYGVPCVNMKNYFSNGTIRIEKDI
jgi:hypothetical protein